jgi:DNA-binding GntR family transcriptional regulator
MSRSAAVSLAPPSRLADPTTIVASFMQSNAPGLPRYLQLQNAIIRLIQSGELRTGAQLPPDQQLTRPLNVSLGTVQKAFGGLAADGWISREHGRGTFIARSELPAEELWQFRFVEQIGEAPLPVSVEFVDRRLVRGPGSWADALGYDEEGYCEMTRKLTVNSRYRCLSRFYARIGRFPKIMKLAQSKMSGNLKRVLADEFNAPTLSLDQFIQPCVFDGQVCSSLEIDRGSTGMVVNAVGRSIGQEIITFQSLWLPAGKYSLQIS